MKTLYKGSLIAGSLCLLAGSVYYTQATGTPPSEITTETTDSGTKLEKAEKMISAVNEQRTVIDLSSCTDSVYNITSKGIYELQGSYNGQIYIDCDDDVTLVLNNVSIENADGPCINVQNAKNVLLYSLPDTENSITSGTETEIISKDESEVDASYAAVYSKDDLFIAGDGKLIVSGYINNGIAGNDTLLIIGADVEVKAVNNGIKAHDELLLQESEVTILSGGDGMKTESDTEPGDILLNQSVVTIEAFRDGIQSGKDLIVNDGTYTITSGGGYAGSSDTAQTFDPSAAMQGGMSGTAPSIPEDTTTGATSSQQDGETSGNTPAMPAGQMNGTPPSMPEGQMSGEPPAMPEDAATGATASAENSENTDTSSDTQDSTSENSGNTFTQNRPNGFGGRQNGGMQGGGMQDGNSAKTDESLKGMKAAGSIYINSGEIDISSYDDSLHCGDSLIIEDGTIHVSSSDDGLHADQILTINGGTVIVENSYEALEAPLLTINGGTVDLTASDDGMNASGENSPCLTISGGIVYVNADGDGLDSNGDLIISGGQVIVDGPSNGANGALDSGTESGGELLSNGGETLAIGAAGMDETFSSDSALCFFKVSASGTAGSVITIKDADGSVLLTHTAAKSFQSVVYSSEELKENGTYTVDVDGTETTVTLDGTSYGTSSGFSGKGFRGQ